MANVDDGILDNGEKFREAFEWDLNKVDMIIFMLAGCS